MLTIVLPASDKADAVTLNFEHSLVSLSKWEEIYEKPFFGKDNKTEEEMLDYFRHMLLDGDLPSNFIDRLTPALTDEFGTYINSKRTATWFNEDGGVKRSSEIVTNELIYFWMISFNIPFDPCETWHLNRLMTLIRICGIKQTKPKPMSRAAQMEQYRQVNEQRRKQLGTNG